LTLLSTAPPSQGTAHLPCPQIASLPHEFSKIASRASAAKAYAAIRNPLSAAADFSVQLQKSFSKIATFVQGPLICLIAILRLTLRNELAERARKGKKHERTINFGGLEYSTEIDDLPYGNHSLRAIDLVIWTAVALQ
jgi:hypothetical protein